MTGRRWLLIEVVLVAAMGLLGAWGASVAIDGSLAAEALRGAARDANEVRAQARTSATWFLSGAVLLATTRLATAISRPGKDLPAIAFLPIAVAASALGLTLQVGYGSPFATDPPWPGADFGFGTFLACCCAAAVLLVPGDIGEHARRLRAPIAGAALLGLVLLAAAGSGPDGTDAKVNLLGVQPMEAIKLAVVASLAVFFAGRAAEVRYQQERVAGLLRIPRPALLVPALIGLALTTAFLFALKDLGPTLIFGLVFLVMFGIVTRSPGWVALALGGGATFLAVLGADPSLAPSATVATRLRMWADPWLNGVPNGDQVALARWAMAAGGFGGSGLGTAFPGGLPAGHTDLVFVHLVEELGVLGGWGYLGCMAALAVGGLHVAARNRTPERQLLAAGLVVLVVAQLCVILGGSTGLIPLTGVVVPFLSDGTSSAAAFFVLAATLVRLAEDGRSRAETAVLRELGAGVRGALVGCVSVIVALGLSTAVLALVGRDATSLRGVVTTLGDGTAVLRHDPRLASIASALRRGSILDRNGLPLAESPSPGARVTPLGDSLGTVLGPTARGIQRPAWSLERIHDVHLRGWPDLADTPAIWRGTVDGNARLLLVAPSAAQEDATEQARAEARLRELGGTGTPRRLPLPSPDYGALLRLARLPLAERVTAVKALSDDVAARTVTVTIDARIQADAAAAAREAARKSSVDAAAVAVLDAHTGQVLARAQWPDLDPSSEVWRSRAPGSSRQLRESDDPTFMGVYGAWSDKTDVHGVWQAGSVFKLLSAAIAVRSGLVRSSWGECPEDASPIYACNEVHAGKPSLMRAGWKAPIHDSSAGGARGDVDLVEAIARSSNVWFGQLALALGPDPYRELLKAGVDFGNPGLLDETDHEHTGLGIAGSRRLAQTGFGQGAASWSVVQAARFVGAVANGGDYRRCPADMRLDADCGSTRILPDADAAAPILSGMQSVMERGTGASLPRVPGVRIYGKTGTADARGTRDEEPWGIRPGSETTPHSWFAAIAEPDGTRECGPATTPRYVVVAVVPHGGSGSRAAAPLALAAVTSLQRHGYLGASP